MTWKLPTFLWKHPYSWWLVPQPNLKKICASVIIGSSFPQGFGVHHLDPVESMWSFCGHHPETPPKPHLRIHCIGVHPGRRSKGTWDCQGRWFLGGEATLNFAVGSGWGHLFLLPICKWVWKEASTRKWKHFQVLVGQFFQGVYM